MRNLLRSLARCWISRFGSPIRDDRTGELLGRALLVVWRGRIHLIGFTGGMPLQPVFRAQERTRYWRQCLTFTRPDVPDFPSKRPD